MAKHPYPLITVAPDQPNMVGGNEVHTLSITGAPTGGSFTLTYSGHTTAAIAWNATAATVQARIAALTGMGVGNVSCFGGPLPASPVTIQFIGTTLGNTHIALPTFANSLTGGAAPTPVLVETAVGAAVGTLPRTC